MKIVSPLLLAVACLAGSSLFAQQSASEESQVKAYIDMMRKDIRAEANSIVDAAMGLEPADKSKFWDVYAGYEKEKKALWDKRLANIKKYAENYPKLAPNVADELATTVMANEQEELAIRKKYYGKMKATLGPVVAARFLQVEVMLAHLINLQVGAQLPLIP